MSKKIILITGASSGFGRLTAEALAKAGNAVYASMRDIAGRDAKNAAEMAETSKRDGVDLRAIELDVQSEPSIDVAVKKIMAGETVAPEELDANYIRRSDAEIFAKP